MEYRQRASQEQFTIILDFMEIHGDFSRPGLQRRIRTERLWLELTELLNSVDDSGILKSVEKWKRPPYFSERIVSSPSPPFQLSPPDALLPSPEPCSMEALNMALAHNAVPVTSNTGRQEDTRNSSPAGPSTPRRRRLATQRRRRLLIPHVHAIKEFVRIEEDRIPLDEIWIENQLQKDLERLRIEAQRSEMLQRITDTTSSIMEMLFHNKPYP